MSTHEKLVEMLTAAGLFGLEALVADQTVKLVHHVVHSAKAFWQEVVAGGKLVVQEVEEEVHELTDEDIIEVSPIGLGEPGYYE